MDVNALKSRKLAQLDLYPESAEEVVVVVLVAVEVSGLSESSHDRPSDYDDPPESDTR